MRQCPGCEFLVPDGWNECRRCGEPLDAPATVGAPTPLNAAAELSLVADRQNRSPAPPAPVSTPNVSNPPLAARDTTIAPGGPAPARRGPAPAPVGAVPAIGFAEELLSPTRRSRPVAPPKPGSPRGRTKVRQSSALVGLIVGALILGGLWMLLVRGADNPGDAPRTGPEPFAVLAPVGIEGLPSLDDVPRVAAEANLQRATWQVVSTAAASGGYDGVDISALAASDSSLQWLDGATPSNDANQVSVSLTAPDTMFLAIRAGDGKCGYVRDTGSGARQVTVSTELSCRADDVPARAFDPVVPGPAAAPGIAGIGSEIDTYGTDAAAELTEILDAIPPAGP